MSTKHTSGRSRAWIGVLLLCAILPARGILPQQKARLEDFDKRARVAEERLPNEKKEAARRLKDMAPNTRVDWDAIMGTPHWVRAEGGFLTDKGGSGKAVSKATAARIPMGDPDRALKAFLNEHKGLFGHDASALGGTRKTREFVADRTGLRTVVFQQEFEKIPVFEALLIAHTTREGELVSVSSHFLPDLVAAARQGMPQRNAAKLMAPEKAVALAALTLGEDLTEEQVKPSKIAAQ